jgi:hypothetical protein
MLYIYCEKTFLDPFTVNDLESPTLSHKSQFNQKLFSLFFKFFLKCKKSSPE